MPEFKYWAVDASGIKQDGVITASAVEGVKQMLSEKGYLPIKIEEVIKGQDLSELGGKKKKYKFSKAVLSVFCRQLASMLTSGIPIVNCLEILAMQSEKKAVRDITWELHASVQQGESFSSALKEQGNTFPELMINLIEAGEVSGEIDKVVDSLAMQYEKDLVISKKVKSSMIYPCVLMVLAVACVVFMLTAILPTFVSMFDDPENLPGPTKLVMAMSDSMRGHWYIYITVLAAAIFVIKKYLSSEKGKLTIDTLSLKIPVIKQIIVKVITARFTRTLSTVIGSGVPLISAMEIVSRVAGNSVATKLLNNATDDIKRGDGIAAAIKRTNFFPPMVNSMLRIGEESGELDDIMGKTAGFYEEEVDSALSGISTLLEPIMLVFMAGCIGFIVIAMIMPMFSMFSNVDM